MYIEIIEKHALQTQVNLRLHKMQKKSENLPPKTIIQPLAHLTCSHMQIYNEKEALKCS